MQAFVCKHCGAQVPGELDACPECFPDGAKREAAPIFLVIVLLCSSFLMVGSSYVNVRTAGPAKPRPVVQTDFRISAYHAAQGFINQRHPGQKMFSDFVQSPIEQTGNRVKVTLLATEAIDGKPVRSFYYVEMERTGESWNLIDVAQ